MTAPAAAWAGGWHDEYEPPSPHAHARQLFLVMPGERVKVLRRFGHYTGLFIYHYHNLEHEDMGMMRNFEIQA